MPYTRQSLQGPLSETESWAVNSRMLFLSPSWFCAVYRIFPPHGQPWCCFRKSAVAPAGPWKRSPGIIAASQVDDLKRLLFTEAFLQGMRYWSMLDMSLNASRELRSKFTIPSSCPWYRKGVPTQEEIHGCQHLDSTGIFCCLLQIFGCRSGLIMVFDEVGPPSTGLDSHLACHDFILKLFHCPFPS